MDASTRWWLMPIRATTVPITSPKTIDSTANLMVSSIPCSSTGSELATSWRADMVGPGACRPSQRGRPWRHHEVTTPGCRDRTGEATVSAPRPAPGARKLRLLGWLGHVGTKPFRRELAEAAVLAHLLER